MKIAIIGAGGIGCYYAARLIRAGHECVLVARGEHLKALNERELEVEHPEFRFHAKVEATDVAGLCANYDSNKFDLLILASKGGSTASIMSQMSDWLAGSKVPVLSIQNGVSNEEVIEQVIGRDRTIGGLAVKIGAHIIRPGVVEATGIAQIDFGAWPTCEKNPKLNEFLSQLSSDFSDAGIPNTLYQDVRYALWRKLLVNNGVNPLSALTLKDTGVLTSDPTYRRTVRKMMDETAIAANAAGVAMSDKDVEEMFELICNFDAIKTSMLVDREKGRPMELKEICEPVIQYCKQAARPAETTELIYRLLLEV